MRTTEPQLLTSTKLKRIAWLSSRDKSKQFNCLIHHFNEESLKECFNLISGNKAVGADGITKADYAQNLSQNLKGLVAKMKRMAYRPAPVRQVLIPKEGKPSAKRPLGISNFEDKIVQKMMQRVLESIYEPLFLECSYGFRPKRGCHDAIKALHQYLYRNEVQTVIDVDLASYFDSIDHNILKAILRHKIKDKRFIRYIARMFKAGVLAKGELTISDEGVPQGSICSPILANIFAHYVIDRWFETVVKRHCHGNVQIIRYADDMVICCQYHKDAMRIRRALQQRLDKYKLNLNTEKTRLVSFSKRAYRIGQKQQSFDFLGFTFYLGRSRKGTAIPKLKSCGKRIRVKLKRVNQWARMIRNRCKLKEIWKTYGAKLEGHIQYYGVSFNSAHVKQFIHAATRILFKWINRRSQRKSFNWEQFNRFIQANPLPKVRITTTLF
jgi:group II intron reverse transcriptase/maturase